MQIQLLTDLRKLAGVAVLSLCCGSSLCAEPVRPDFTGIWTAYFEPGQTFGGGGFAGFGAGPALPFTPEGKARRDEYQQLLGPERANPAAYCVDYGMPAMMESAGQYPIEFIQKPDQLTIVYEVEGELRRVYLGDRKVPEAKRLPSRQGYSEGHWEGDTLVVVTTDLLDSPDQQTNPHSDQARILERFSLGKDAKGTKILSYEMTMTDSVYYTKPIVVNKKWAPLEGGHIMTYRCPDEFWLELLEMRRAQLKAGVPANARMSDVYKQYESKE